MGWSSYTWGIVRMSTGFFFLFMAFNTAQNLESTIVTNNQLVNVSLACLYGVFTVFSLFAAKVVNALGPRIAMVVGAIPYVLLVFANIHASWGLFIPAFTLVGFGAAILWTAQGIFLSRSAIMESQRSGEPVEHVTSRYNGLFWTAFQFNGAIGLVIASTIFVTSSDYDKAVTYLFIAFGAIGGAGASILLSVPSVKPGADMEETTVLTAMRQDDPLEPRHDDEGSKGHEPKKTAGVLATARFLCTSRPMQLLLPIIFYNGASLGFNSAMFPLCYADIDADPSTNTTGTERLFNHKLVGYVSATFYLANSFFSYTWGNTVPKFGRRPLFVITLITQVIYYAVVIAIERGAAGLAHNSPAAFATIFLMMIIFAAGDSVLESQLPAIIQSPTFFPDEADRDAAISGMRVIMSLGYTIQFAIGIGAPGNVFLQAVILFPLMGISLACLWWCDRFVRPIDTSSKAVYSPIGSQKDMEGSQIA